MTVICVCKKCGERSEDATVEFNFFDGFIYFLCPSCKYMNRQEMKYQPPPLPKSKVSR